MDSLLEPDAATAARDREAADEAPRAGVWAGELESDLQLLTQDQTDLLIRRELLALAPQEERAELRRAFGGFDGGERHVVKLLSTGQRALGRQTRAQIRDMPDLQRLWETRVAETQRGGLDSDPLVRVLAVRAWGDRDRRWFADRGVRAGDEICVVYSRAHHIAIARTWSAHEAFATALGDARPGEDVMCEQSAGRVLPWQVSDRVRLDPAGEPTHVRRPPQKPIGRQRVIGTPPWEVYDLQWNEHRRRFTPMIRAELQRGMILDELARQICRHDVDTEPPDNGPAHRLQHLMPYHDDVLTLGEARRLVFEQSALARTQRERATRS